MDKIYFVTSNKGKIKSLQEQFKTHNIDIEVEGVNLNIIEPQADTVKEVSIIKAKEAFEILKAPIIVEDGGFCIDELKGFPGVYSKYILETIGAQGLLDIMRGKENRNCGFVSCTTFIDQNGKAHQFERLGGRGLLTEKMSETKSEMAWSELWKIFYAPQLDKVLCEASKEELLNWWKDKSQKSSVTVFVEWLKDQS